MFVDLRRTVVGLGLSEEEGNPRAHLFTGRGYTDKRRVYRGVLQVRGWFTGGVTG